MRVLLFAFIILSLGSCSKYEEGKPSAASKKSRLVNNWTMVKMTANGYDITALKAITGVDIYDNNNSYTDQKQKDFTDIIKEEFGVDIKGNYIKNAEELKSIIRELRINLIINE